MVKPSPALHARLRFTTKQVARGFYRGNRTGSMGAHTEYGRYTIDWRKTTHYNVPDTTNFPLTPFITQAMERTPRVQEGPDGKLYTPSKVDGLEFMRVWKNLNPAEHEALLEYQAQGRELAAAAAAEQAQEAASQQDQESTKQQMYSQSAAEPERSPFQQQQTRQLHTSSRRLISAQQEQRVSASQDQQQPSMQWNDMTRAERKSIINATAVQALREARKETGEKLTTKEKKAIKYGVKLQLRQDLVGDGILQDEKAYAKIMIDEGRRRSRQGLPRRTPEEKREFLDEMINKSREKGNHVENKSKGKEIFG